MQLQLNFNNKLYTVDTANPLDISIPISREAEGPNAFYLRNAEYHTVEAGSFVGNVARGGSCNVEDIIISPHGNGTHTECAGHVAAEDIFITNVLKQPLLTAALITVSPENHIVTEASVKEAIENIDYGYPGAIVIRTNPNSASKKTAQYSGTDPAYFSVDAVAYINSMGVNHILTDLPSLDKEDDDKLKAHHAFFEHPEKWNLTKTVTEMIFVPDAIKDGLYLLDLQIISLQSDASPSKPLLYAMQEISMFEKG
jgi:kynurenine formamidase